MAKIVDLTGKEFGGVLTVLRLSENQITGKSARWTCLCGVCGEESDHTSAKLRYQTKYIKSCGCLHYKDPGKRKSRNPDSVNQLQKTIKKSGAVPKKESPKPMNVAAMKADLQQSLAPPVDRNISPQIYRKQRDLTAWEQGRRDAIACGAGRYNF